MIDLFSEKLEEGIAKDAHYLKQKESFSPKNKQKNFFKNETESFDAYVGLKK